MKVNAQSFEFRPSIGWGHGWSSTNTITTNLSPTSYNVSFSKNHLSGQVPQIGLMFDYNHNNNWLLSVGRIHGKTQLFNSINGYTGHVQSLIQKFGIEFFYRINKKSAIKHTFIFAGIHYCNNTNNDYNAGNFEFTTVDSLGVIKSRYYDYANNIYSKGYIISSGIRISFVNRNKNREILSVTINYDLGLTPLWTYNNILDFNYLQDYVKASSTSKGSQLKIYLSKPIKLYKVKH